MKSWAVPCAVLLFAIAARAEKVWDTSWSKLKEQGALTVGQIVPPDANQKSESLKLENRPGQSGTFPLLILQNPSITRSAYAVVGRVRSENVAGTAYLELTGLLSDGKKMTVRTLASGKLAGITGTSDWREFQLPIFIGNQQKLRPTKIEVNLVLPGIGIVYLTPLQLHQFHGGAKTAARSEAAVGMDHAHLAVLILYAGVLAVFGFMLFQNVRQGKSRDFVLHAMLALMITGCLGLLIGTLIVLSGPKPSFFGPFRLVAALQAAVPAAFLWRVRKRYEQLETPVDEDDDEQPKLRKRPVREEPEEVQEEPEESDESAPEPEPKPEPQPRNDRKGLSEIVDWDWDNLPKKGED